ncbi:MAG: hypothetical protein ACKVWR_08655 [Acidimicrobiales bacterium]
MAAAARRAAESCASAPFAALGEHHLSRALFTVGRYEESAAASERVLALARSSGNVLVESASLMNLALCTREDGSPTARQRWRATLAHVAGLRNWQNTWILLEALAADWAERGMVDQAAIIAAHLHRHGAASPSLRERRERLEEILAARGVGGEVRPPSTVLDRDAVVAFALRWLAGGEDR